MIMFCISQIPGRLRLRIEGVFHGQQMLFDYSIPKTTRYRQFIGNTVAPKVNLVHVHPGANISKRTYPERDLCSDTNCCPLFKR